MFTFKLWHGPVNLNAVGVLTIETVVYLCRNVF